MMIEVESEENKSNIPNHKEWSVERLVKQVIWESIMEGTAWCGWTDGARGGLVRETQHSVLWALEFKGVINTKPQKIMARLEKLMMKLCGIGIHSWGKWESCQIKTIILSADKSYSTEGQKRVCRHCNKKKLRSL